MSSSLDGADPACGDRKGAWTPKEDVMLSARVAKHGTKSWTIVSAGVEGRSAKSCRLRWYNQLCPGVKRTPFSEWEQAVIILAQKVHTNKWAALSKMLRGRTDNAIKNHWNATLCRKLTKPEEAFRNQFIEQGMTLEWLLQHPELDSSTDIEEALAEQNKALKLLKKSLKKRKRRSTPSCPSYCSSPGPHVQPRISIKKNDITKQRLRISNKAATCTSGLSSKTWPTGFSDIELENGIKPEDGAKLESGVKPENGVAAAVAANSGMNSHKQQQQQRKFAHSSSSNYSPCSHTSPEGNSPGMHSQLGSCDFGPIRHSSCNLGALSAEAGQSVLDFQAPYCSSAAATWYCNQQQLPGINAVCNNHSLPVSYSVPGHGMQNIIKQVSSLSALGGDVEDCFAAFGDASMLEQMAMSQHQQQHLLDMAVAVGQQLQQQQASSSSSNKSSNSPVAIISNVRGIRRNTELPSPAAGSMLATTEVACADWQFSKQLDSLMGSSRVAAANYGSSQQPSLTPLSAAQATTMQGLTHAGLMRLPAGPGNAMLQQQQSLPYPSGAPVSDFGLAETMVMTALHSFHAPLPPPQMGTSCLDGSSYAAIVPDYSSGRGAIGTNINIADRSSAGKSMNGGGAGTPAPQQQQGAGRAFDSSSRAVGAAGYPYPGGIECTSSSISTIGQSSSSSSYYPGTLHPAAVPSLPFYSSQCMLSCGQQHPESLGGDIVPLPGMHTDLLASLPPSLLAEAPTTFMMLQQGTGGAAAAAATATAAAAAGPVAELFVPTGPMPATASLGNHLPACAASVTLLPPAAAAAAVPGPVRQRRAGDPPPPAAAVKPRRAQIGFMPPPLKALLDYGAMLGTVNASNASAAAAATSSKLLAGSGPTSAATVGAAATEPLFAASAAAAPFAGSALAVTAKLPAVANQIASIWAEIPTSAGRQLTMANDATVRAVTGITGIANGFPSEDLDPVAVDLGGHLADDIDDLPEHEMQALLDL